ncbi:MAG: ABC transporter permease subunit, partial [Thermoplasmata archaeon]|nr:ABC transporter permease subunit [Thermoplasmata archaeon]
EVTERLRVIVIVGHREDSPWHVSVVPEPDRAEAPAGSGMRIAVRVVNTGTEPDTYRVRLEGLPRGWKGTFEGLSGDPRAPRVGLAPGETAWFDLTFELPGYPLEHNLIAVVAASENETSMAGSGLVYVRATDIPDKDMTGSVMAGPGGVMGALYILFAIFTAAVVGSKAISTDIRDRSTTIYLSRPITKVDYASLKFLTVLIVLSMVTIVPALTTYAGMILLSDVGAAYVWDHLWVWGAVLAYGLLVTVVLASLSLGFSAITSRRFYAAFGFVVTALVTPIIAQIITGAFGDVRGTVISVPQSLMLVGMRLLDVPEASFDYDPLWNLASAIAFAGAGLAMVAVRISRTELSE